MKNKPVFYDTDCLACFLVIGDVSILCNLFSKIIIPKPVYEELSHDGTPLFIKTNLYNLIEKDFVEVKDISIISKEYTAYKCIKDGLWSNRPVGKGEASAIAFAIKNNGVVASNNLKDVKELTEKYELPLLTTALILAKSVQKGLIDESRANSMWKKMLERNRNLPDNSFSDYYSNRYKKDCEEFLDF
ncbi:hypothetical protein [Methanobrevibacter filiformis]|uniref:PIN domain-containing protein n=1 Tax=Methanobrevibacter filiformis TaxID=55758 RepID=A0A166CVB4_9EURY|nr:hypothetical protein MBFIL_07870 [Methanobrevibacter filiformis]